MACQPHGAHHFTNVASWLSGLGTMQEADPHLVFRSHACGFKSSAFSQPSASSCLSALSSIRLRGCQSLFTHQGIGGLEQDTRLSPRHAGGDKGQHGRLSVFFGEPRKLGGCWAGDWLPSCAFQCSTSFSWNKEGTSKIFRHSGLLRMANRGSQL